MTSHLNDLPSVTLTLGMTEDGALQQALFLGQGNLVVGETPGFSLLADSKLEDSNFFVFSLRVVQALRHVHGAVNIEYPSTLAHLPWQRWVRSVQPNIVVIDSSRHWMQRGHRHVTMFVL